MTSPITSRQVALQAGVSQSTVSLVLSGKARGRVTVKLQDRVFEAAQELGYRPNHSARALRSGRSRALGLLVPDVTNPFLGRVLRGAQSAARQHSYAVALVEPGDDRDFQIEVMQSLQAGSVDGLVLFVVAPPAPAIAKRLGPIVLIEAESEGMPSVVLDIASGAQQALDHLRQLGHRRIAYLGADIPLETFRKRTREWDRATAELGMTSDDRWRYMRLSGFSHQSAREVARELLMEQPPATAIFCDDDVLAAGVRLAAADLHRSVPRDLSIVGFAGTVLSEVVTPALTTVIAPAEELGACAIEQLIALIEERADHSLRTVLPVHLEIRQSTAPPGSSA
jgi:LacI family transcriptional regulator, repressor for deo operon, udp, cdd, tsx, nupC, and nupG